MEPPPRSDIVSERLLKPLYQAACPLIQQGIDAVSMFDGSSGPDEYMNGWEWGQHVQVDGSAEDAAAAAAGLA